MLGVCAMRNYLRMLLCVLCCVSGAWAAVGATSAAFADATRVLASSTRASATATSVPGALTPAALATLRAAAPRGELPDASAASALFTSNPLVAPGSLEEDEQLRAARAARMSSPEAIVAREVSQTAFAHLDTAGAATLAREAFPGVVDVPDGGTPPLRSGEKIVRYVSDNAAQLALPDGRHAVIESLGPIAKQTSRGHFTPLNLSLGETAGSNGAFTPKTALAAVSIPKRLTVGIRLAATGVTVTPVSANGTALDGAQGTRDGASVLYANTQTATDTLVKPTVTGFELDALLRAADSPSALYFIVAMPAGAHLHQNRRSGVVSVIRHGRPIAAVLPPIAHDASETPVPTLLRVVGGDRLVLTIDPGSREFQYPIEVDPTFEGEDSHLAGTGGKGYGVGTNWLFCTKPAEGACVRQTGAKGHFASHGWGESGPLVSEGGGGYLNENYAAFIYTTEGETHIYTAGLHTEEQNNINEGPGGESNVESYMQIGSGTLAGEFNNEKRQTLSRSENGSWPENKPIETTENGKGNSVIYGAQAYGTGEHFTDVLWSGTIYIEQPETIKPEVALNTSEARLKGGEYANILVGSNKWLSLAAGAIGFNVKEKGLGVSRVWADAEVVGSKKPVQIYEQNLLSEGKCSGIQCPEETTPAPVFTYNEKTPPPNGVDTLIVHAESAAKNQSEAVATINVDNEPPMASSIKLYGLPSNGQIDEQPYKLRAEATDGSGSTKSSGIESIELDMDGHTVLGETKYGSCTPGPCTTSSEWTISGEHFPAGTHKVKVIAWSYAHNKAESPEYTVTVRHASLLPAGPGSVNPISGALHLGVSDVSIADGAGALSVSRSYDSREPDEGEGGPLGPQWQISIAGDQQVQPEPTGAVTLVGPGGDRMTFESNGKGGFVSPSGHENLVLEAQKEGETIKRYLLKDPASGTTVTYKQLFSGGPWLVESSEGVLSKNNGEKETFEWEYLEGVARPKLVVAPAPDGLSCVAKPTETIGCRSLEFKYAESTTAAGEAPSEWKSYKNRLEKVLFRAYNPATIKMESKPVAEYAYDKQGRLRAEWDPRIEPSLKTTYGYDAEEHVTSVNPPGQEPWLLHYGTTADDLGAGRLLSVTRPPAGTTTSVKEQDEKSAPVNTAAPTLSTTGPAIGTALSVSTNGTWSNSPLTYSYAWEDCNGKGKECIPIPGAVNQSYTPVLGDAGYELVAQVMATNATATVVGSSSATSVVALPAPTHSTPFGSAGTGAGQFDDPGGTALEAGGEVWATDAANNRIEEFSSTGSFIEAVGWGVSDGKSEVETCTSSCRAGIAGSGNGELSNPEGIAVNQVTGNVYVIDGDTANSRVQEFSSSGTWVGEFGGPGAEGGELKFPHGIAVNTNGDVWVADTDNNRIDEFSSSGTFTAAFGWGVVNGKSEAEQCTISSSCQAGIAGAGNGEYNGPHGVAVVPDGNVYITDSTNKRVQELSSTGSYLGKFGESELSDPWGISTSPLNGALYITDPGSNHIAEFTAEGSFLGEFGSYGSEEKEFNSPVGIAISTSTGKMYIADEYNNRIDVWSPNATVEEPLQAPPTKTSSAVTTIDYDVPLEGNSELHTMTKAKVEEWGQKDLPTEATAIFPPDKPMGWPAKEYKRAAVWYFDEDGRAVNVANSAGGVLTSEYNEENEVIRSLSADNRETALKAGNPKEESEKLDTKSKYNGETEAEKKAEEISEKEGRGKKEPGARLLETTGPEHEIRLAGSSTEKDARNNVRYYYNEGAPAGETYDLATKVVDSAKYESGNHEERKTTSYYSGQEGLGWLLRTPTSTTVDPGGLNLTTTTIYDPNTGKTLETRGPGAYLASLSYLSKIAVSDPHGVALDAKGDLWVVGKSQVEEYGPTGTKLLSVGKEGTGNGEFKEPHGIAFGPGNTLWVVDTGNSRVQVLNEKGEWQKTVGTLGTVEGDFKLPSGVAFGPGGDVWVTDTGNNRIEEFNQKGEYLKAINSKGEGGGHFTAPSGIAVDGAGNVWITNSASYSVEEFTQSGVYESEFGTAGEGMGQFEQAQGIAVDANGHVWVADAKDARVQEFSLAGEVLGKFGGEGSGNGQLKNAEAVVVDKQGDVWVGDSGNNRLEEFAAPSGYLNREYQHQFGEGEVNQPKSIAVNSKGDVWVLGNAVEEYGAGGGLIKVIGEGMFSNPRGIAIDKYGDIWVVDGGHRRVAELSTSGSLIREITHEGAAETGHMEAPLAISVNGLGDVFVILQNGSDIGEYNNEGKWLKGFGAGQLVEATALTVDNVGDILATEFSGKVLEFKETEAGFFREFGKSGSGNGQLNDPQGIVSTDEAGDIWVADQGNDRIEEFNAAGEYLSQFGSKGTEAGQFEAPAGLAMGGEGGLWVADSKNDTIEKWIAGRNVAKNAQDSETVYYSTKRGAACDNRPEWAELPCISGPGAQPGAAELPNMPTVTDETYNIWDEAETVEESFEKTTKFAAATRAKKISYDSAGRVTKNEVTSSVNTALPGVSDKYSAETGALVEQSTVVGESTKAIKGVYNTLGQLTEYTDADGNTTTYTYDEDGRLKTVNDGKGTQTYTYSPTSGLLTELTDSSAKTVTASYDVEGKLVSESYPNAMKAMYTYSSTGDETAIEYEKTAHCAGTCPETWFKETIASSIHGEVLLRSSSLAKEEYTYDNAGRLTQVNEVPTGKGCKTRLYVYNEDSDRVSQTSRESSTETCATSGGTTVSHSYDAADRLTDSGVEYETLGNQTKIPAADAEGQAITASFYADNQTHIETQGGKMITYNIDPAGRVREMLSEEGSKKITTVNHYAGAGETISWASEEEGATKTWTRNISGIDGALMAVEKSGEETTPVLLLHDLEGNIVAEAKLSETETKLIKTYNSTEFGVPVNGTPPKFSWLGALGVGTETPSGDDTAGGVSYVSQLGAVMQTQTVIPPGAAPNGTYLDPYISKMTPGAYAVLAGAAAESNAISERIWREEHPPPPPPPGATPLPNRGGVGGEGDEEEGGGARAARRPNCQVAWTVDEPQEGSGVMWGNFGFHCEHHVAYFELQLCVFERYGNSEAYTEVKCFHTAPWAPGFSNTTGEDVILRWSCITGLNYTGWVWGREYSGWDENIYPNSSIYNRNHAGYECRGSAAGIADELDDIHGVLEDG